VDTIPLVGEQVLADAVRAVGRLSHARAQGLLVISLNMASSVPDASDLVVSDPVQTGVPAVMAIADSAKFTIARLHRRVFELGPSPLTSSTAIMSGRSDASARSPRRRTNSSSRITTRPKSWVKGAVHTVLISFGLRPAAAAASPIRETVFSR